MASSSILKGKWKSRSKADVMPAEDREIFSRVISNQSSGNRTKHIKTKWKTCIRTGWYCRTTTLPMLSVFIILNSSDKTELITPQEMCSSFLLTTMKLTLLQRIIIDTTTSRPNTERQMFYLVTLQLIQQTTPPREEYSKEKSCFVFYMCHIGIEPTTRHCVSE